MYIMIVDYGYEGQGVREFSTYPELAKAVYNRDLADIDDIYKIEESLDKFKVHKDYEMSATAAREKALAKLSDEDILALGITR